MPSQDLNFLPCVPESVAISIINSLSCLLLWYLFPWPLNFVTQLFIISMFFFFFMATFTLLKLHLNIYNLTKCPTSVSDHFQVGKFIISCNSARSFDTNMFWDTVLKPSFAVESTRVSEFPPSHTVTYPVSPTYSILSKNELL